MISRRTALGLIGLLAVGACPAADSQLTAITGIRGELRVGVVDNAIPFSYVPPGERDLAGHQVDLARQLAADMGVRLQLIPDSMDRLVRRLGERDVDIIMAATPVNPAMAKTAAFTRPWGYTGVLPVTLRASASHYASWPDFRGKGLNVGFRREPPTGQFLSRLLPNAKPRVIDSTPAAIAALVDGSIDVFFTNSIEASVMARGDNRVAVPDMPQPASKHPLACLVHIEDAIWLHYVNTWLDLKRETGLLDALHRKWGLRGQ